MEKRKNRYFIQRGYNSKYPNLIEVWKYGEIVPEWLSDIAKVDAINLSTKSVNLAIRNTNIGGYEILDSSGQRVIVRTKSRLDYICKSDKIIFSLTPEQFRLLYYEKL